MMKRARLCLPDRLSVKHFPAVARLLFLAFGGKLWYNYLDSGLWWNGRHLRLKKLYACPFIQQDLTKLKPLMYQGFSAFLIYFRIILYVF